MPTTAEHHSLVVPPFWIFRNVIDAPPVDGKPGFDRDSIVHFCKLNKVPETVFFEPDPTASENPGRDEALKWIERWNARTPSRRWQFVPGDYRRNQGILVFHWYLKFRLFGCPPIAAYEEHFLLLVNALVQDVAGAHLDFHIEPPKLAPVDKARLYGTRA